MGAVKSNRDTTWSPLWTSPILRLVAALVLLVTVVGVGITWLWPQGILYQRIIFILLTSGLVFYIIRQITSLQRNLSQKQQQLDEAEAENQRIRRHSEAIIQLSQKFVEANDEIEILRSLLSVTADMVGAVGASVVPLDERGQPLSAISHGDIPKSLMDSWVEYLASPEVRHRCSSCLKTGSQVHTCPLVEVPYFNPLGTEAPSSIYCLHLQRGEREFGILNLYLGENQQLDQDTQDILQTLLDETALVLASIQSQQRELTILQQMRHQTDIQDLQLEFLENVQETLRADFVLLHVLGEIEPQHKNLRIGDYPQVSSSLIEGVIEGVQRSGKPLLLGEVEGEPGSNPGIRSIICAPLGISNEPAFGVILAGRVESSKFSSRHLSLLQTLAGQLSLVVRNAQLKAEIEFNSIMAERTRLAREIHDGLAQTLGFLKLQAAQMENYLALEDTNRLQNSLKMTYKVLSDAYLDVRQAIDDLRITPGSEGLESWVRETCHEFEGNTGIRVNLDISPVAQKLPPEIQVQLIRIIQEALSNVRKHAQASQAWVEYQLKEQDFLVEIRDDGIGFHPDELPGVSQYGLQGMRERSEIIGADLTIISAPQEGTIIKVRVPIPVREGVE